MSHQNDETSKTKIVTIKGVDSHLYSHFSTLVNLTPAGSGRVFSHILHHYLRNLKPQIPVAPKNRLQNPFNTSSYQIIENQKQLVITRHDFESIGLNVQFIFLNINELIFDETVDTQLFERYVHSIKNSNVVVKGNIAKLVLLSINRSTQRSLKRSKDLKDVTIRNVDVKLYEEFTAACHKDQITVGEGMNQALSALIPHLEVVELIKGYDHQDNLPPILVTLHDKVNISNTDLDAIGDRTVLFHRIINLSFDNDISNQAFINKVLGIYNCETVTFPKSLPKLLQLSKNKTFP